jgi:hypothetical protein
MIELKCFQMKLSVAQGGLGQAEHFWKIVSLLWPATSRKPFLRNPWGGTRNEFRRRLVWSRGMGSKFQKPRFPCRAGSFDFPTSQDV